MSVLVCHRSFLGERQPQRGQSIVNPLHQEINTDACNYEQSCGQEQVIGEGVAEALVRCLGIEQPGTGECDTMPAAAAIKPAMSSLRPLFLLGTTWPPRRCGWSCSSIGTEVLRRVGQRVCPSWQLPAPAANSAIWQAAEARNGDVSSGLGPFANAVHAPLAGTAASATIEHS
jgi:hypothetical protein